MTTELVMFKEGPKCFKDFSISYKDKIVSKLMKTINKVSHNHPEQFFEHFLKSSTARNLIMPIVYEYKVKPLMETICDHYETAVQVHKLTILSMVATHFRFDELVKFGFSITKAQLDCARVKDKKKSRSTKPVTKPNTPKQKLPDSTLVHIIQFCLENSSKSRAKKVHPSIVEHLEIPGYDTKKNYDLNNSKRALFAAFKNRHPELKVSLTSFYKFVPQNFIAPKLTYNSALKPNANQARKEKPTRFVEAPPTSNPSFSNSVSGMIVPPPPPPNQNYSNSVNDMSVPPPQSQSNSNYSNSATNMSVPPPLANQNYSNSLNDMIAPSSNQNYSNSAANMSVPPPPSNQNYSNSAANMSVPPPHTNQQNYSNSAVNMSVPPPLLNQNYSNSAANMSIPPPPLNQNYSNSAANMSIPPPPLNQNYSNSAANMTIPPPPSNASYPNSAHDMGYLPPLSNPYTSNSTRGLMFPPSSSDPNRLNSVGDMGLPPPSSHQSYSNSNSYMANPSDGSRFYHPNLTFDSQRPS